MAKGDPLSPPGRFDMLAEDHPLVGRPCVICLEPFEIGDLVALIESGKEAEGLTIEADPAHEGCVVWMAT
jgi:hypothetical protein